MPRFFFLFAVSLLLLADLAVAKTSEDVPDRPARVDLARLESLLESNPPERAVAQFRSLLTGHSGELPVTESELTDLGYRFLGEGRNEQGAAVLQLATELMPEAFNAWDSLGEARMHLGDRAGAEAAYRKSLELNPDHRNATRMLEGLDRKLYEFANETQARFAWQAGQQTGLKGPYLAQELSGHEAQAFAPGLISTKGGFEFSCTFSPDGREFYFNRQWHISVCRLEEDGWTAPRRADFNTEGLHHEAHITTDGQRLFFGARRQGTPEGKPDYGIWYMDRQDGCEGWGEVQYHGTGMYVTNAANRNLYLTDIEGEVGGGLAMQRWDGEKYGPMERLPDHLNDHPAAHPCIAPDESWLIFDARRPDALGGAGDDDFYISFRGRDGSWGEPVHLDLGMEKGNISDPGSNMCASVTPDGKLLFFHGRRDIHWVSAGVLERFRP